MARSLKDRILTRITKYIPEDYLTIQNAMNKIKLMTGFIEPQSPQLRQISLDQWKAAVRAASDVENPDRTLLYQVYDSVMLDLHLGGVIDTRVLKVQCAQFKVVDINNWEEDEELTKLFEDEWFDEYLEMAMMSIFYGHSLIEDNKWDELGKLEAVELVNRNHVIPEKLLVIQKPGDTTGINYAEGAFPTYYTSVGKKKDLGLLMKISPVVLAKKYAMGAYSEFTDKFGIPFRSVKTPSRDDDRHRKLGLIMQKMGSAGWAVLQDNEAIELTYASGVNADTLFLGLINFLDDQVSKAILGQTGTTDMGEKAGTYGSLKVLKEVAEDRHKKDKRFIMNVINNKRIPMFINQGINLQNRKFVWDDTREIMVEAKVDLYTKLSQYYDIDPEYISDETGIPIIGVKAAGIPSSFGSAQDDKSKEVKKKPQRVSNLASLKAHMNTLYGGCGHAHREQAVEMAITANAELIAKAINRIIRQMHGGLFAGTMDADLLLQLNGVLAEAGMSNLGINLGAIDYDSPDNLFTHAIRNNIASFSAAKTYSQLKQYNDLLLDEDGKLKPFSTFKNDVLNLNEQYNTNWLRTERNHAVASGQMSAQWKRYYGDREAMPNGTYRTVGDNRVREKHALLDDLTAPLEDPIWNDIWPPNGPNCRCDVEQGNDPAKLTDPSEAQGIAASAEIEPLYKNNVGKTATMFKESHPYFKDVDGSVYELKATDQYGMKDSRKIYADSGKLPKAPTAQEFESWYREQKQHEKGITLGDLNGNRMLFDKKVFGTGTDASLANDVLTKPTEVWQRKNETAYIKMYQDKAVITVTDKKLNATSYTTLEGTDINQLLDGYREGVLMHK